MSFLLPATYKTIANKMGEAYQAVKDSIYKAESVEGEVAYNRMQESHALLVEDPDNDIYDGRSSSTSGYPYDPQGSIANDLGSLWFRTANNEFTESRAKSIASGLFAGSLRKLNTHMVNRTGVTNIATFYSSYAYNASYSATFNLFAEGDTSSYFSQEFADLSAQIGVTIDSQYIQP